MPPSVPLPCSPYDSHPIHECAQVLQADGQNAVVEVEPGFKAFTLYGFLLLNKAFVEQNRCDTSWRALKHFGYDSKLKLVVCYSHKQGDRRVVFPVFHCAHSCVLFLVSSQCTHVCLLSFSSNGPQPPDVSEALKESRVEISERGRQWLTALYHQYASGRGPRQVW